MRDEQELPKAEESIASIRTNGDPFADSPLSPLTLEGVTYEHPEKGTQNVALDPRVLGGYVYTNHEPLRSSINDLGITYAWLLEDFVDGLREAHTAPRLFWGFSGFASKGKGCGCELEADAMETIYGYFVRSSNRPRLVCDGGSGAGVLALNGVLAAKYDIESVGFTPFQGVASMGVRDQMVIARPTYKSREVLVGTLPDILVCVGGGGGTRREAVHAVEAGNIVLLVMLRGKDNPDILAGSWHLDPKLMEANEAGTLLVCEYLEDLPRALEKARKLATQTGWRKQRETRIDTLSALLKA